jgi:hypothetical protein
MLSYWQILLRTTGNLKHTHTHTRTQYSGGGGTEKNATEGWKHILKFVQENSHTNINYSDVHSS